jgi:molybdate transport system substrate-binding protein
MRAIATMLTTFAMSAPGFAADVLPVYAAGSLREPLTEISRAWQLQGGAPVVLTFGASGLLRERLERGEQAAVFASADTDHPRRLARAGGWDGPMVFARNALCALTAADVDVTPQDLLALILRKDIKLATSTPKSDPSGDYAWEMFRKADRRQPGAYATLDGKTIKLAGAADSPQPPKGRLLYAWAVETHQADVFLTYCSNAIAARREVPALRVVLLPPELHVDAAYGIAVKAASTDAHKFAEFMLAPAAQAILVQSGFLAVKP